MNILDTFLFSNEGKFYLHIGSSLIDVILCPVSVYYCKIYRKIYTMEIHMCNKYPQRAVRGTIFHLRLLQVVRNQPRELSARSHSEYNDLKSVTDCFKRGLALSAAALAPENCLALFSRATHLIIHARFSCSADLSHLSFFNTASPLSFIASTPGLAHRHTHIHTRTHVRMLYVPTLFSFPFLLLPLGLASTPFPHPRSSSEFCGKRVSLSSFLSLCLPYGFFFLSLFCQAISRPLRSALLKVVTTVASLLYRIYRFSLGTIFPTRSLSIPRWRNSRPLQRQPNKCLSDYLHRHFSATLS